VRLALPPISCKVNTPMDLAKAIVQAVGDDANFVWLEPSHGTGPFLEAISQLGVEKQRLFALDLDPRPSAADNLATTTRGVDFLRWARGTEVRFDRIVGNPPFISIKRLPTSLQGTAASVVDVDGQPIGRTANVWYAFVLASLGLLKDGGCIAFVLPSAAEFADYSAAIRHAVQNTFSSLELYRCTRPLFEDVQEGTLVAVARGYGKPPCMVRHRRFQSRGSLIQGLAQSGRLTGRRCRAQTVPCAISTVRFDSIAKIRLGGVTGAAAYFLMNEERRQALALPAAALTPVVSRATHLRGSSLNKGYWNELKASAERIWLFRPTERLAEHPNVSEYLNLGASEGGCDREAYKISMRKPWYRTPLPNAPHAFLSGMSQTGPWLCINEMIGLNATNTLYVVTFRSRNREVWYMWALALLSSVSQQQIRRIGRRYADGLVKYEPGPLGQIALPKLRGDVDHRSLYERAVDALLSADPLCSREIADSVRL
jgi:adenine-specific DNA-methyltransferase